MGDNADFVDHVAHIGGDPFCLVGWVKAPLQTLIVCRDAGRAGVLVALQCLDAAQRKHEATRAGHEIGAHAQGPGNVFGVDQLARCDDFHALAQPVLGELVDKDRQALAQRQADRIDQRHRRRAGAAFGTVYGDEVRRRIRAAFDDLAEQLVEYGG